MLTCEDPSSCVFGATILIFKKKKNSIRFAPPLVITEEDLMKAVSIIGECLEDLDKVCSSGSSLVTCDLSYFRVARGDSG